MDREEKDRLLGVIDEVEDACGDARYELSLAEPDLDEAGYAADRVMWGGQELARSIPFV